MYCKTYRIGYNASNTAIHNSYSIHVMIRLYIHRYNISNTQIYICNARIHSTINSYKQYVYSYTNQQPMKRKPFLHRFFLPPNPYGSHKTSMVTASQQATAYIHTYIYISYILSQVLAVLSNGTAIVAIRVIARSSLLCSLNPQSKP